MLKSYEGEYPVADVAELFMMVTASTLVDRWRRCPREVVAFARRHVP
jgi:hypothetical protein